MKLPSAAVILLSLAALLLPAFAAQAQGAKTSPLKTNAPVSYTITLTDRLRISLYQEEDLSVIARVDAKGQVNLPLVGEVTVAELSVADAQKVIETAYQEGRFLRNPQVTITIEEYAPREVSIQGEIRSPGRYPLPIEASMTVIELVTRAGGLTDTAKGTEVTITRVGLNGKKEVFTIDVESLIKGRAKADVQRNALMLKPGDIVYVPQRII